MADHALDPLGFQLQLPPLDFVHLVKHFTKGADLLQEILDQRPEDTKEFNKNLGEVISFLRYMNEEIPVLFKKWDEQHKE